MKLRPPVDKDKECEDKEDRQGKTTTINCLLTRSYPNSGYQEGTIKFEIFENKFSETTFGVYIPKNQSSETKTKQNQEMDMNKSKTRIYPTHDKPKLLSCDTSSPSEGSGTSQMPSGSVPKEEMEVQRSQVQTEEIVSQEDKEQQIPVIITDQEGNI